MSSSDKFDWSLFTKREVPVTAEVVSPASEVVALLQSWQTERRTADHDAVRADGERMDQLAELAVRVVQLAKTLDNYKSELEEAKLDHVYRALKISENQLHAALENAELEIVDLQGKTFDEISEHTNIIGWRHHANFATERVAEVIEPAILYDGLVIRPGRVIMGAPLKQKPMDIEITKSKI